MHSSLLNACLFLVLLWLSWLLLSLLLFLIETNNVNGFKVQKKCIWNSWIEDFDCDRGVSSSTTFNLLGLKFARFRFFNSSSVFAYLPWIWSKFLSWLYVEEIQGWTNVLLQMLQIWIKGVWQSWRWLWRMPCTVVKRRVVRRQLDISKYLLLRSHCMIIMHQ
jgi:hypothetical protein